MAPIKGLVAGFLPFLAAGLCGLRSFFAYSRDEGRVEVDFHRSGALRVVLPDFFCEEGIFHLGLDFLTIGGWHPVQWLRGKFPANWSSRVHYIYFRCLFGPFIVHLMFSVEES